MLLRTCSCRAGIVAALTGANTEIDPESKPSCDHDPKAAEAIFGAARTLDHFGGSMNRATKRARSSPMVEKAETGESGSC
jgi:hypothetical protein